MPKLFIWTSMVLVLFFLSTSESFGQDFRPGFIVTNNGDSISGFVKNRSPRKNSNSCRFKQTSKSKAIFYKPNQLKSFGIYNYRQYESKEIISNEEKKLVFLELLVDGKLSLLSKRDNFFVEKDSFIVLPPDVTTKIQVDGKVYNKKDQRYVAILNEVIADCGMHVEKIEYGESELVDIVMEYNKCKGTSRREIKADMPRNLITWNVLVGIDQTRAKFDTDDKYFNDHPLGSYHTNPSISVPAGFGFEWSRPSRNDRFFFGLELWYDKKFWQGYLEDVGKTGTLRSDVLIHASYLKMPVNIRFNLRQEKNTPYIRLGFTHYGQLKFSGQYIYELEDKGKVLTTRATLNVEKKSTEGFWFALGYSLRLFGSVKSFIEGRYEINNGFTNPNVNSKSMGTSAIGLIGLKF